MASLEEGEGGPRRVYDGPKGRNGVREGADRVNRHPTASSRPNDGTRRRAVMHRVHGGVAAPSCSRWEEDLGGIRPARRLRARAGRGGTRPPDLTDAFRRESTTTLFFVWLFHGAATFTAGPFTFTAGPGVHCCGVLLKRRSFPGTPAVPRGPPCVPRSQSRSNYHGPREYDHAVRVGRMVFVFGSTIRRCTSRPRRAARPACPRGGHAGAEGGGAPGVDGDAPRPRGAGDAARRPAGGGSCSSWPRSRRGSPASKGTAPPRRLPSRTVGPGRCRRRTRRRASRAP